jgi:hypothetical protein
MHKEGVRETLELAVERTCAEHPNFQGVYVFGSFVTEKADPGDLDLIPVLGVYEGDWGLQPVGEDVPEHDPDYYAYADVEMFFAEHFRDHLHDYDALLRTHRQRNALIHIERILALDDQERVLEDMMNYEGFGLRLENFLGHDEAVGHLSIVHERLDRFKERLLQPSEEF